MLKTIITIYTIITVSGFFISTSAFVLKRFVNDKYEKILDRVYKLALLVAVLIGSIGMICNITITFMCLCKG